MSKFRKSDTTESALHAVEEALKIDFKGGSKPSAAGVAQKVKRMATGTGAPITARQNAAAEENADASQDRNRPATERKAHERTRTRRAANDDVRSVGNLLYALQRRPSYTPFWVALLVTHRLGRPRHLLRRLRCGATRSPASAASRACAPRRICSG